MDQSSIDMSDASRAICPNGDLVLVIGRSKTRLRVFSQCLACASRVFGAMFRPDWAEGQKLSKEISPEILLVDDNVPAMYTICCVIHHRNSLLPTTFTPHEILQIAIHADKYDLCSALSFAKTQWLQERGGIDHVDMACLMAASLLFDDMDMFLAHGLALMFHSTASFSRLLKHQEIWQILPTGIICKMMAPKFGHAINGLRSSRRAEEPHAGRDGRFNHWGDKERLRLWMGQEPQRQMGRAFSPIQPSQNA